MRTIDIDSILLTLSRLLSWFKLTVNETVPKIIINKTIYLFLNCNRHFANFRPEQFPSAV